MTIVFSYRNSNKRNLIWSLAVTPFGKIVGYFPLVKIQIFSAAREMDSLLATFCPLLDREVVEELWDSTDGNTEQCEMMLAVLNSFFVLLILQGNGESIDFAYKEES